MMFVFNSVFKNEFEIYLALRRKTVTPESAYRIENILSSFDRHLMQSGLSEKTITEMTITSWIQSLSVINSERTISDKVSCIRKWLEHLRFCGFPVFIPTCPKYSIDYVPYIFSDEEVDKIFSTADEMNFAINRRNNNIRFTLPMLIEYLYTKKNIAADDITFKLLNFDMVNGFLCWLETERKSSVSTRNLRLTALSSFAKYTQNRNIDAATVFMNAVKRVPIKTPSQKPRTFSPLMKFLFC